MSDKRLSREQQIAALEKDWAENPRWKLVKRGYSAADVVRLRGSLQPEYTLAKNGHVRGDVLYGFFSPRVQAGLDLALYGLFFLPGVLAMTWAGWNYAQESLAIREQTFSAEPLPLYPFKFVIPLAGAALLLQGLAAAGLPEDALQLVEDTSRASANELMTASGYVDLLIPRGGAGLIRACVENAKVPCIQTGTGICHIFVDDTADQTKALDIIENAKASRPSVCNAEEVCLVHSAIAGQFLPRLAQRLGPDRAAKGLHPVDLRLDKRAASIISGTPAGEKDFDTEFLDYILAVKVVDSVEEAIGHIAEHSTGHSEAILTQTQAHADLFTAAVDSAAVYVNCSTRFTDGGEFGLGCEMGISTQKLHARGPMGLEELCSYKYVIHGDGQIR